MEEDETGPLLTLVGKDVSQVGSTAKSVRCNGATEVVVARVFGRLVVRGGLSKLADRCRSGAGPHVGHRGSHLGQ